MSVKEAWLMVSICMGAGLVLGTFFGYALGKLRGKDVERARCIDTVSGRLCDQHYPKREFAARLNDPCDWCDRVAECVDYIEIGLPRRVKVESGAR